MELRFHSSHSDYDYYGIEQKTADERTAECLNYMSTKPGQAHGEPTASGNNRGATPSEAPTDVKAGKTPLTTGDD
jgi:hypothetical protein